MLRVAFWQRKVQVWGEQMLLDCKQRPGRVERLLVMGMRAMMPWQDEDAVNGKSIIFRPNYQARGLTVAT